MAQTISNMDDTIDSRDVIERINELEDMVDNSPDDFSDDEEAELNALITLREEAEPYCPDWTYGAQLIRDSYFEDYAQELAEDIGAIDKAAGWPNTCIDWKQAARELRQDYTAVEFDGITYWTR